MKTESTTEELIQAVFARANLTKAVHLAELGSGYQVNASTIRLTSPVVSYDREMTEDILVKTLSMVINQDIQSNLDKLSEIHPYDDYPQDWKSWRRVCSQEKARDQDIITVYPLRKNPPEDNDYIEPHIEVATKHGITARMNPAWINAAYEMEFYVFPDSLVYEINIRFKEDLQFIHCEITRRFMLGTKPCVMRVSVDRR